MNKKFNKNAIIAQGEKAKIAARQAKPAPIPTEPKDPDAELKKLINDHNDAEMRRFNLESAVMHALLERRGSSVRYNRGSIMTDLYCPDWDIARVPHVLVVERLGEPKE
jgi:hypothetical protein